MLYTPCRRLAICLLILGASRFLSAQEDHLAVCAGVSGAPSDYCDCSQVTEYFIDSSGLLDFPAVRECRFRSLHEAAFPGEINLQNCRYNFWLRFRLANRPDSAPIFLFAGEHHFLQLFSSANGLDWVQQSGGFAGGYQPGDNEYLRLQKEGGHYYLRIANRPRPDFPIRLDILSQQRIEEIEAQSFHEHRSTILPAVSVMAIWVFMAVFSLLQFGQHRERVYLYYALYVLSLAFGLLKIQESQWQLPLFFSYFPSAFVYSEGIAAAVPHITYRLFVADITDLRKHLPGIARLFDWTILFLIGYIVVDALLEYFFFREAYCVPLYLGVRVVLGMISVYCIVRLFAIRTSVARMVVWGTVVLYAGVLFGLYRALTSGFDFQGEKVNLIVAACTVEILIFSMALGRKSKLVAEERNRLEKDLLEAHTRIARDLHDDLGSGLSSIALNSQVAADQPPDRMREALRRTGHEARELMHMVRDLMWSLQPENDTVESLATRMRQFALPLLEAKGIDVYFEVEEALLDKTLHIAQRRHCYLFFKEAVNNLAKYAGAARADIRLSSTGHAKYFLLEIADDGRGFDPEAVQQGHGLSNLAERAAELGGVCEIESAPGDGTTVRLTFPLQ
jgi:signal transduction histidine kinase